MQNSESILAPGWALAQQLNLPTRGQIMQHRVFTTCSSTGNCHHHSSKAGTNVGVASPKGFPTKPTIKTQTAHGIP